MKNNIQIRVIKGYWTETMFIQTLHFRDLCIHKYTSTSYQTYFMYILYVYRSRFWNKINVKSKVGDNPLPLKESNGL